MTKEITYRPSIRELLALVILDPDAQVTYPAVIYLPDENQYEEEWVTRRARDFCLAQLQEEKKLERLADIPF
ncbi:MAG: hypothetical protein KDE24_20600 [Caldilinea sp.]|nr:hypothetical protein [Caldilinea sp.]